MTPSELRYTKDHEWAKRDGDFITVGISDYAQSELGDILFLELPVPGKIVNVHDTIATLEAVKSVNDVYAPVSGEIVAVNDDLRNSPEKINKDPYGDGWMVKKKIKNPAEFESLMNAEEYKKLIGEV